MRTVICKQLCMHGSQRRFQNEEVTWKGLRKMSSHSLNIERRKTDVPSQRKTKKKKRGKKLYQDSVILQSVGSWKTVGLACPIYSESASSLVQSYEIKLEIRLEQNFFSVSINLHPLIRSLDFILYKVGLQAFKS